MKFSIKGLTDEMIRRNIRINKIADYMASVATYLLTLFMSYLYYIPDNDALTFVLFMIVCYTIYLMLYTILFKYDYIDEEVNALKINNIINIFKKGTNVIIELDDGKKLNSVLLKQVVVSKFNDNNLIDFENGIVYIKKQGEN